MLEVMIGRAKILSLVVMAALVWTTSVIDAWADSGGTHRNHASPSSVTPSEHPVSCHAHSRIGIPVSHNENSPTPVPSNYKCCLTGHDAAVLRSLRSQPPSAHGWRLAPKVQFALAALATDAPQVSIIFCADPPNITALRI